jgi:deoxyguanosine kinase
MRYIAIEGPIGVGKTRLVKRLATHLGAQQVLEPADTNPFLDAFYADMERYALVTQMTFLVQRYQQQQAILESRRLHRDIITDYMLERDKIFAVLTLNKDDFNLYEPLYDAMAARAARPDLVVLLKASTRTLMQRIGKRGRPCEAGLDARYIERLNQAYDDFFRVYTNSPLLTVDTEGLNYPDDEMNLERLVAEMKSTREGQRIYAPLPTRGNPDAGH